MLWTVFAAAVCAVTAAGAEPVLTADLDPRLELAGAARLVDDKAPPDPGFAAHDIPYVRRLRELMKPYRGRSAPFDRLRFLDRGQILLRLSALPALEGLDAVPYSLRDKAGGARALAQWVEAMRHLARDSNFAEEFPRLRPLLDAEVAEFRAMLGERRFVKTIEDYCDLPFPGSYRVHLSPFHAAGGVANVVTPRPDGSVTVDSIVGPEIRGAGVSFVSRRVPATLWHELAHGVIDPLGDLYAPRIQTSSAAFAPIASHCYGDWRQCVKEHAVRAVMLRLLARYYGEDVAAEHLAWEGPHYPYLKPMTERLKDYEKDRARWPTLADFYPVLLSALPEPPAAAAQAPSLADLPAADEARARRLLIDILKRSKDARLKETARRLLASPPTPLADAFGRTVAIARARNAAAAAAHERGIALFLAGKNEEALAAFGEALAQDALDAQALASRAVVLARLGRLEEAESDCAKALALAKKLETPLPPDFAADALSTRAAILERRGRREAAAADLREALEVAPSWWKKAAETRARLKELSP